MRQKVDGRGFIVETETERMKVRSPSVFNLSKIPNTAVLESTTAIFERLGEIHHPGIRGCSCSFNVFLKLLAKMW
jgi:CO dehydrogenase nickel-insertion accessory protein CooC1